MVEEGQHMNLTEEGQRRNLTKGEEEEPFYTLKYFWKEEAPVSSSKIQS